MSGCGPGEVGCLRVGQCQPERGQRVTGCPDVALLKSSARMVKAIDAAVDCWGGGVIQEIESGCCGWADGEGVALACRKAARGGDGAGLGPARGAKRISGAIIG